MDQNQRSRNASLRREDPDLSGAGNRTQYRNAETMRYKRGSRPPWSEYDRR